MKVGENHRLAMLNDREEDFSLFSTSEDSISAEKEKSSILNDLPVPQFPFEEEGEDAFKECGNAGGDDGGGFWKTANGKMLWLHEKLYWINAENLVKKVVFAPRSVVYKYLQMAQIALAVCIAFLALIL
jgi:hypothetical protein